MAGIRLCSTAALPWETVGKGNVRQKVVRNDPATGAFLGMMSLDALARTGLHKHLDVGFAFHLAGCSTNYSSVVRQGQLGISLAGTVHETVIYEPALTIVRTEGGTMFPPPVEGEVHLHSGALHGELKVDNANSCGCFSVDPQSLPYVPTVVGGVGRRMLFDYLPTGKTRRVVEFMALPDSVTPPHLTSDRLEFFVIAGDLTVNGTKAGSSDFMLVEAGERISWKTSYGCRLLVWADGPASWTEGEGAELYGFNT